MECEITLKVYFIFSPNSNIKDTENEDYSGFRDADAILVPVGDLDEDSTFKKSTSLQVC